jgi:hypothetical protein
VKVSTIKKKQKKQKKKKKKSERKLQTNILPEHNHANLKTVYKKGCTLSG